MLKPIITLKDIAVSFDGEQVLKNFNLTIGDGEFVTLLGPSGCGKTTVLRTIGGFVTPDSGDVFFGDEKINNVPPHKRAVNTIFQKYALFPHLNVYENIAFGMLFYTSFSALAGVYAKLSLGWLYFAMYAVAAFALMVFGTVFTAKAQLFEAKDNKSEAKRS